MTYTIQRLRIFVDQTLNARSLVGREISEKELDAWLSFINNEKLSLESLFTIDQKSLCKSRKNEAIRLVRAVTMLNNIVYKNMHVYFKIGMRQKGNSQIRLNYLRTCIVLEEMIEFLSGYLNGKMNVPLSQYKLSGIRIEVNKKCSDLRVKLISWQIPSDTLEIIMTGLQHLFRKKGLTNLGLTRLYRLLDHFNKKVDLDPATVLDQLVMLDFNTPEFFLFLVNRWKNHLNDLADYHEQIAYLINERERLLDVLSENKAIWQNNSQQLYKDLQAYLLEKQQYIKEALENKADAGQKSATGESILRFLIGLTVPQFALFIRLLIEKGILPKEKVGEIFRFFSMHFYTKNTNQISAESLQKKSSDVEFSTAIKLKEILIGMVNWLNTNYNLSKFN